MSSSMEIDFLKLNRESSSSKMEKQQPQDYGKKRSFSSMLDKANIQADQSTFFPNHSSNWIVPSSSTLSQLNNEKISLAEYNFAARETKYFGEALPKTSNFALPFLDKPNASTSRNISEHSRLHSTLTIFYSGEVYVFPNVTPEKAELIMHMAARGMNLDKISNIASKEKAEENTSEPSKQNSCANNDRGVLVMARTATLARFLEERKHRLINESPYKCDEKSGKYPFDQEEETASSGSLWES
ncbi:protein JAZ7-like isoform X2 [Lycium barbarum]|uniref:protein JAZ7-like isoform X2 n=1 Tax=Lycium barbarum TaxID=112863 RepID=UPI00293F65BE|nr:protein JAZ7-like isoform X2 [Lycium barbarum]